MRNEIRELIKSLEVCADPQGDCKDCPFGDHDANCLRDIKQEAAAALKNLLGMSDSKEVIINDMYEKLNRLMKENELLWRKQNPIPMDVYRCPVCGTQQHYDHAYCNECGQALKAEKDKPRYFVRGEVITDDIEMLTNLNDRS